ncbi:hypothetical protein Leryth_003133 [Lithospermum erythrorhizon]|nr:hypothetical protein Leryth_003133 [Lithospermum erythrorhizon]
MHLDHRGISEAEASVECKLVEERMWFPGGVEVELEGVHCLLGIRGVVPLMFLCNPFYEAIERRRARTGEDEGQSSQSRIPFSSAHFEHDTSLITPEASSSRKPSSPTVLEVPKILLDITNDNKEDSEFLTPQKKLLNSIDSVEKVVMEELNKQKRTPSARKAERKKKVKTLMSMR